MREGPLTRLGHSVPRMATDQGVLGVCLGHGGYCQNTDNKMFTGFCGDLRFLAFSAGGK